MSFSLFLTCTAKSHALIEGHIIANHRSLPDNDTVTMVNKKALADLCARMVPMAGLDSTPVLRAPFWETHLAQK